MADRFPVEDFDAYAKRVKAAALILQTRKKSKDKTERDALQKQFRKMNREARRAQATWAKQHFLRWTYTPSGFRERLVAFWADHFTVIGKSGLLRHSASSFVESAIRPNLSGRFSDMLFAATTHPVMLDFLDQTLSVGPESIAISRNKRLKGLNENLAREVMELHTLGVDGPYTQEDVRQLAELLTGVTYFPRKGFQFRKAFAEPGAETVLGRDYSEEASLDNVRAVLEDLATHPATADHIARKLAVHFVSDKPDADLVAHVSDRYRATGGALDAVYAALIEHPAAWQPELQNAKPPLDFMASAFRALEIPEEPMQLVPVPRTYATLLAPLDLMGQPWRRPSGPDGWAEEDTAWITPQGIAARLQWAMNVPQIYRRSLPDPREFAHQALGSRLTETVRFAAGAAESRAEAIGLVLCAPAFQRR
ncbi:MAG: DUF1800 domain-containing protein [Marinibacterium sp.]